MDYLKKSDHYHNVVEFMLRAGQEVPTTVKEPSAEIRTLRAKLILEEAIETIKALGVKVYPQTDESLENNTFFFGDQAYGEFNLAEVIDGCCDIKVVTTGTLIACGIPDEVAQQMVDQSNLKKFGPGGHRREDGKWIKPQDWQPPNWQDYLHQLEREQS